MTHKLALALALAGLIAGCRRMADMKPGSRVDQDGGDAEAAAPFAGVALAIAGVRNPQGQVVCNLFESEGRYDDGTASLTAVVEASTAREGTLEARFPDLDPGRFGIVCFHDENRDLKLGTNFLGMPTEGVGCSNDAKGGMGHGPYYSEMEFRFDAGRLDLPIAMHYL